jgi:tetratricopeptide (TPR) repeat protein
MNRPIVSSAVLALASVALAACVTSTPARERGVVFYESGSYLAAADAFTEDIRLHPRDSAAWNDRAVARVRLGDLDGAVRDYNRAVELSPGDAELYFNRGNALVAQGQYREAIADYDRATSINPVYARAAFNRGTARALAGDADGARRDWQSAIALESDPYERAAMRRSAGLEPVLAANAAPAGVPTTAGTIAPAPVPGTRPGAQPAVPSGAGFSNVMQPAAAPLALDARALTSRAISRQIDGDHAGAIQDLTAAISAEPDPQRRAAIDRLRQLLDRAQ